MCLDFLRTINEEVKREAVCLDFLRTINEEVKRGASCSNNDAFYNSKASLLIVRGIVVVILPDNNDALEKD